MRKTLLGSALLVLVSMEAAAQSVTVTKPAANDTCTKGQACMIRWTVSGQPGSKVILELLDKVAPTVIRMIASDVTIGDLQYSWTVPGDIATGQYRVQVRVYGASISDAGDVFNIKAPSGGIAPGGLHGSVAQSIADKLDLDRPAENDSFHLGTTVRIHWVMPTPLGGSVRITLWNPGGSAVQTIADSTPNKGAYDWVIPTSIPVGSYRIKIQVLNSTVSDTSGLFTITEKPSIAPGAIKILRVTSPPENQIIKPPNEPIHVVWETEYPPPFTGEICKKDLIGGHWVSVRTIFRAHTFDPVPIPGGLSRYTIDVLVNSDDPSVRDGWYKFKIALGEGGGMAAFSPAFRIERGTVQKQVILEAAEIADPYLRKVKWLTASGDPYFLPFLPYEASRPGLSRVGFNLLYESSYGEIKQWLDIFRSKIKFPLDPLKGKTVQKATLRLVSQGAQIGAYRSYTVRACGGSLYFLTKPWSGSQGDFLSTPGVRLATIPNQLEWTIDVTQPIKDTVRSSGGFPNEGFLLTSIIEDFFPTSEPDVCITWYKAYLILQVVEDL